MQIVSRRALKRLLLLGILLSVALIALWWFMLRMPGRSHRGPLPPATEEEIALSAALERDVRVLADEIGERRIFRPEALERAAAWIRGELEGAGYRVERQPLTAMGRDCENLEVETAGAGRAGEIVVGGAHNDSVGGCPAANDNGSGVAAALALARSFAGTRPDRTLRFVLFVNEEPPFFKTGEMGSRVYARRSKERGERVTAMLSLETIGCYLDAPGSQRYPFPLSLFYPSKGDFIGFVGNSGSRRLVREVVGTFRKTTRFPSEGAALPSWLPGISWSDHWSFFSEGYPAVMVTDTAPFRYAHYHRPSDTPDKLDYDRMARVVAGLGRVVERLAGVTR